MARPIVEEVWSRVLDDEEAQDADCRVCHGRGSDRWGEDCSACGGMGVDFGVKQRRRPGW